MEHQVGPREVRELLEQYKSVVIGREPECLPPQREISHCIDLILGATLPNKAAYKLNPEQMQN